MVLTPDPRREPTALDRPIVWQEITRVARAALRTAAEGDSATPPSRMHLAGASADGGAWEVRVQPLLQAAKDQPVIVVALERIDDRSAHPPKDAEVESIRDRFGLSPRQAEVATLLARRFSDREIAERLGIKRSTARRHVEIVMMRLRVHRRSEVGELLGAA